MSRLFHSKYTDTNTKRIIEKSQEKINILFSSEKEKEKNDAKDNKR